MLDENSRTLRKNYVINLLDGGFFGLGLGFASTSAVLPLFISSLTHSAVLIGLIPAIQVIGWQLPQLITARQISHLPQFKPTFLRVTIHERLPYLGLAAIALFLPAMDRTLALVLVYLMLIWQGLGGGLAANPWLNMLGKVFPGRILATALGFQSSAASLTAALGAYLAGLVLQGHTSSLGFFYSFLAAGAAVFVSWACITRMNEPSSTAEVKEQLLSSNRGIREILTQDIPFRWFVISKMISQLCLMAFSFYIIYGVRRFGMDAYTAGVMTSIYFATQVVANPLFGWLGDRWNKRRALEIGAVAATISAAVAFFAPSSEWLVLALILAGIANSTFWTISMAVNLEFGNESERPTYVGIANTLVAPATFAAPIIGGLLADRINFQATFFLAALSGILVILIIHEFVVRKYC